MVLPEVRKPNDATRCTQMYVSFLKDFVAEF